MGRDRLGIDYTRKGKVLHATSRFLRVNGFIYKIRSARPLALELELL